ncbi:hypothetical protein ACLBWH_00260 [Sphingomonas sp. M6A6_1c]
MADAHERWFIYYDYDTHVLPEDAPAQHFHDYADEIIRRANNGDVKRTYEKENRVARIAQARRVELRDGTPGLAFVVTLGDRRGSSPSWVHYERGEARDAERWDGEVKGLSCHVLMRLTPDDTKEGRYRMLVEETPHLGRAPLERLLNHELREQAFLTNARFRRRATGSEVKTWVTGNLDARRSQELADAFDRGKFMPIELIDTSVDPTFDEDPEFETRGKKLMVRVSAGEGGFAAAINKLKARAAAANYGRMKIRWTPPGQTRPVPTEIATDLADIGTALFAKRELLRVENPLSDCSHVLVDELVEAMVANF